MRVLFIWFLIVLFFLHGRVRAGGIRIKSDDGAVGIVLSHRGPRVERDERDGIVGTLRSNIQLPVYNCAMSSEGDCIAVSEGHQRLLLFCKRKTVKGVRWRRIEPRLWPEIASCTRIAVTNDEEAERIMGLRLIRDECWQKRRASDARGPVLIVVQKEIYSFQEEPSAKRYQLSAIDIRTGEVVSFTGVDPEVVSSGQRTIRPVLAKLMTPKDVISRLKRIMPLKEGEYLVGRSVCLREPPPPPIEKKEVGGIGRSFR